MYWRQTVVPASDSSHFELKRQPPFVLSFHDAMEVRKEDNIPQSVPAGCCDYELVKRLRQTKP
jgi:hypothetical protein